MRILSRCFGIMVLFQNRIPGVATTVGLQGQGYSKTGGGECAGFGGTHACEHSFFINNQAARNQKMKRGALIVFEGGDHSGKTTQCKKLEHALASAGESVKFLKFPDRTSTIGKMIDNYLGNKCEIEDHSVHLLFSANRWEKQPRMMKLLESGTTLIVDRYAFSGVAFTAAKPGFDMDWCKQPDIGLPKPDLVCFLTLDTEAAAKRGTFGGERYERTDFQKKVLNNFQKLKDSTWKEIDADKTIEDLHKEILDLVTTTIASVAEKPIGKLWMPDDKKTN